MLFEVLLEKKKNVTNSPTNKINFMNHTVYYTLLLYPFFFFFFFLKSVLGSVVNHYCSSSCLFYFDFKVKLINCFVLITHCNN